MNRKDWKLIRKLQDEDQEEKALLMLDNLLGLDEMSTTEKIEYFLSWIVEHDPSKLIKVRSDASGKSYISLSDDDIEVRDLGLAGVVDILETRALCFSSLIFSFQQMEYAESAIENSLIIRSIFHEPSSDSSMRLWELAMQPLLCRPDVASLGIDMLCSVIQADPERADGAANQIVITSAIPQTLAQCEPENPAHASWDRLQAVLASRAGNAPPPNQRMASRVSDGDSEPLASSPLTGEAGQPRRRGWFARLFRS